MMSDYYKYTRKRPKKKPPYKYPNIKISSYHSDSSISTDSTDDESYYDLMSYIDAEESSVSSSNSSGSSSSSSDDDSNKSLSSSVESMVISEKNSSTDSIDKAHIKNQKINHSKTSTRKKEKRGENKIVTLLGQGLERKKRLKAAGTSSINSSAAAATATATDASSINTSRLAAAATTDGSSPRTSVSDADTFINENEVPFKDILTLPIKEDQSAMHVVSSITDKHDKGVSGKSKENNSKIGPTGSVKRTKKSDQNPKSEKLKKIRQTTKKKSKQEPTQKEEEKEREEKEKQKENLDLIIDTEKSNSSV